MTTYNTGNPIGSADPKDLYDNAENFDEAINSNKDTFTDRLGRSRPTLKGGVDPSGIVQTAVNAKDEALAARDAAIVNSQVFPDEATGRAAVADGEYFKVIGSGDVAAREYKRLDASTSVLVAEYPSSEAINTLDSISLNRGKAYPFVRKVRGGIDHPQRPEFNDVILDAKIYNANPNFYYRIAIIGNGHDTLGGPTSQGVRLERCLKSTYESTGAAHRIHMESSEVGLGLDYEAGGVQRSRIQCDSSEEVFEFLIDVDALPPWGTQIISANTTQAGYNWVIDPVNYYTHGDMLSLSDSIEDIGIQASDRLVTSKIEYRANDMYLNYSYLSHTKWYRVTFSRKAINNSFTILGFGYADAYNPDGSFIRLEDADFIQRTEASSDWVSPMVFRLVDGGDPVDYEIYTGGSHGTDNAEGDPTSEMIHLDIYVDGARIRLDEDLSTSCNSIRVATVNQVLAANTIDSQRYAAEEYLIFDISASGVFVKKKLLALYDLDFTADNGLQIYAAGLTPATSTSYLMFGANQTERKFFDETTFNSGPRSSYPKVCGVSLRHPIAGEFSSWMDISYGVATRDHLPDHLPMLEYPRAGGKIYPRLFKGESPFRVVQGDSYEWNGGYYWGMPTTSGSFDTVLQTQSGVISVKPNGSYIIS